MHYCCTKYNLHSADSWRLPLIVGGGINSIEKANAAWNAGADMVVVGTLFEKQPEAITLFSKR